jgi:hypothetical protein
VSLFRDRAPARAQSPALALLVSIGLVVLGSYMLRNEMMLRSHGRRVLARITSVSHGSGRHRGSTTHLSFTTPGGSAETCAMSGSLGQVGTPIWIDYLPERPTVCGTMSSREWVWPIGLITLGMIGIAGAWALYQRARRGEQLTDPGPPPFR